MDAVIVQIDTDVCQDFGVIRVDGNGRELEPSELIEKVKETLIDRIGPEFYQAVAYKILFAITVDSIECWLLPLHYTDGRAIKYKNCVDTLNQKLQADGWTIGHKNDRVYEELSRPFKKKKELILASKKQVSLKHFITELDKMVR